MSEHPPTPNPENSGDHKNNIATSPPSEWDFVKDVSFSKDVTEFKIPGQDTEYDYAYYSDNQEEPVWEHKHDSAQTELKTAVELAMEKHNVSPKAVPGLVKEQILSKNEQRYNELRDRIYAIEQTYPDINGDPQSDKYKAIPSDIIKEWKLAKEYAGLLMQPLEGLDKYDDVKEAYGKLTKSNDAVNIVESGKAAKASAIFNEYEALDQQNQSLIKIPEEDRPIPNADNLLAEWRDELSHVEDIATCQELMKKIEETIAPGQSPFSLRAIAYLKESITPAYQEKYNQFQAKEKQAQLKQVQAKIRMLSKKYKYHPDALGPADLNKLRKEYDKHLRDAKYFKELAREDVARLNDIRERLDQLPKSRFRKRKKIEQELKEQESDLKFNIKFRDQTAKKLKQTTDHLRFLELGEKAKQLESDLSSLTS